MEQLRCLSRPAIEQIFDPKNTLLFCRIPRRAPVIAIPRTPRRTEYQQSWSKPLQHKRYVALDFSLVHMKSQNCPFCPSRRVSNPSLPFTSLQVGNQFVSQYYTVLHSSPKHLHRFYSDRSTLTYADVIPEGDSITQNLKTATGQKVRMLCCTCIETGGPACIIF